LSVISYNALQVIAYFLLLPARDDGTVQKVLVSTQMTRIDNNLLMTLCFEIIAQIQPPALNETICDV